MTLLPKLLLPLLLLLVVVDVAEATLSDASDVDVAPLVVVVMTACEEKRGLSDLWAVIESKGLLPRRTTALCVRTAAQNSPPPPMVSSLPPPRMPLLVILPQAQDRVNLSLLEYDQILRMSQPLSFFLVHAMRAEL